MITFTILLVTLLTVAIVVASIALACGAGFIAAFGDLIICGLVIYGLVKLFRRKRK